jgi:hypothetical protein
MDPGRAHGTFDAMLRSICGGSTVGLFKKKQAEPAFVAGLELHCEICKHASFYERQAQLNTAVASFFDFDWANPSARCLVCERCGYIHWFLPV